MVDRRAAGAALCCALLVLGVAPHAAADERQAAKDRVVAAKRVAARVQAEAELAIERHNGALARLSHALAAQKTAEAAAQRALDALAAAQEEARLASGAASAATAFADEQRAASEVAQEQVEAAQTQLNRFAAGSYRSAGSFGMVAQLISAPDPLELAHGRVLMNSVADVQHETVLDLGAARDQAARAAADAAAAQAQAEHAEDVAVGAVARSQAAAQASLDAKRQAVLLARHAHRLADQALRARNLAMAAVARADATVHRAVLTSARLEAAAREARRRAQGVSTGRTSSAAARTAMRAALDQVGVPYSWGGGDEHGPTYGFAQGAGTKGFDCSGLTLYAYAQAGIRLDHYTGTQWNQGQRIATRAALQPGDLMFFAYDPKDESTIHHVAIYLGNGRMVEAPYTGEVVRVTSSARDDFIGGVRPWA